MELRTQNFNEIFLLLSVSKYIYTILTNNNNNNNNNNNRDSFLQLLISNQRMIDYLLKLIDSLNDIANNGPQLSPISEICDKQDENRDGHPCITLENWVKQLQRQHKLRPVKRFRTRIKKIQSICTSMG